MNADVKQRQLSLLAYRLSELSAASESLDEQVSVAAMQAARIRELGAYHAAWFMASARVMAAEDDEDDD